MSACVDMPLRATAFSQSFRAWPAAASRLRANRMLAWFCSCHLNGQREEILRTDGSVPLPLHAQHPDYLQVMHGLTAGLGINDDFVLHENVPQYFLYVSTSQPSARFRRALLIKDLQKQPS